MNIKELIKAAREAQNKSYSPYSNFRVGCALLMKDGNVISGANIENASYSLTVCAERSTLFTAHNLGYKKKIWNVWFYVEILMILLLHVAHVDRLFLNFIL